MLSNATKLSGSAGSDYYGYYGVTFDGIENLNITGTSSNNLLIVQGTGTYDGKDGTDVLYADWSSAITALNLDNSVLILHKLNGSTVSNIERLLVKTGSANDVIKTGNYDDVIYANAGNDSINAGAWNDVLNGGAGNDTLTGGTGNDLFVFKTQPNNNTNVDLITDFASGVDHLQFSKAIFAGLHSVAGNGTTLKASEFVSSPTATHGTTANSHLIYNTTSGVLYYDADGNAAGAAVKVAILGATTHPALAASDILIIA